MKNFLKKYIYLLLILLLLMGIVPISTVAKEYSANGFTYDVENNVATITDYIGNATKLVIPSELNGYKVTSIGTFAFKNCKSLTSITIPNSVTALRYSVFANCSSLENVNIPKSVTDIEDGTFEGCTNLKHIYYDGSESDWNKVFICSRNGDFKNAEIHFEEQNNTETPTDATEKPIVNTDKQVENKENTNSKLVKKSKDSTKTIHLTIALVVSNCLWAIVMVVVVIVLRKKRT